MKETGRNIPASIHARLLDGAHRRHEDFNLTLKRYAIERFLYRLGASPYRNQFILKGAMLFPLWGGSLYRATRDLDLTGYTSDDMQALVAIVQEICVVPCPEDALRFQPDSVQAEPIRDKSEYHGFRVKLVATFGKAELRLQVDIGFGDTVVPPALDATYPVLAGGPAPRIRAYPREAVVAEKFHAMVVLGAANSRYKDFYDMCVLATHFPFGGAFLRQSIEATFTRRATPISGHRPLALTPAFYSDAKRSAEWHRYLSRSALPDALPSFNAVGELVQAFLAPLWNALSSNETFGASWLPGGPWQ